MLQTLYLDRPLITMRKNLYRGSHMFRPVPSPALMVAHSLDTFKLFRMIEASITKCGNRESSHSRDSNAPCNCLTISDPASLFQLLVHHCLGTADERLPASQVIYAMRSTDLHTVQERDAMFLMDENSSKTLVKMKWTKLRQPQRPSMHP